MLLAQIAAYEVPALAGFTERLDAALSPWAETRSHAVLAWLLAGPARNAQALSSTQRAHWLTLASRHLQLQNGGDPDDMALGALAQQLHAHKEAAETRARKPNRTAAEVSLGSDRTLQRWTALWKGAACADGVRWGAGGLMPAGIYLIAPEAGYLSRQRDQSRPMNRKGVVGARRGPFPARVLAPAAAKFRLCRGR